MTEREEELSAALLWLRNHYDVGSSLVKETVLAAVDRVLADGGPVTGKAAVAFRKKYCP